MATSEEAKIAQEAERIDKARQKFTEAFKSIFTLTEGQLKNLPGVQQATLDLRSSLGVGNALGIDTKLEELLGVLDKFIVADYLKEMQSITALETAIKNLRLDINRIDGKIENFGLTWAELNV